jgi:nitrite reductase/ring-hydroxylating ferredoxin subunit
LTDPATDWTIAGRETDLAPGQAVVVRHAGECVAVFNVDGTFYACSDACPHAGGPLHQGFVRGTTVSCPWHGWAFSLAAVPDAPRDGVLRYPVRVVDGEVMLGPPGAQ